MFERRFVETVLKLAKDKGMTQQEFAKAIWPLMTDASATTTIIALKRVNSRGKPQNLRVSDAIKMAEIVGREYPSLCFEVWENLKIEMQRTKISRESYERITSGDKTVPIPKKTTQEIVSKRPEDIRSDIE